MVLTVGVLRNQKKTGLLQEMHRVLKRNGYCAVIAEPNYTEMQAKPESLWNLAEKQRKILCEAGGNIESDWL